MQATLKPMLAVLVATMLASVVPLEAAAQDFRIESWVFRGKEKDPISESLTLCKGGVVYDFALPELNEITVFDPGHARFVLLDCTFRVKTILTTREVLDFVVNLKTSPNYAKQSFLFEPSYKESYDAETKWLTLAGKDNNPITYRAKLLDPAPTDPDIPKEYRRFADWYSRFNAVYKGNLHTLARIPLNQAIANRGTVPEEVELVINGRVGKAEVRSRHLFNWALSATDMKRIEKAGEGLSEFEEVSLEEFKKAPGTKVAAGKGK